MTWPPPDRDQNMTAILAERRHYIVYGTPTNHWWPAPDPSTRIPNPTWDTLTTWIINEQERLIRHLNRIFPTL